LIKVCGLEWLGLVVRTDGAGAVSNLLGGTPGGQRMKEDVD
jgi:hypothetical protein